MRYEVRTSPPLTSYLRKETMGILVANYGLKKKEPAAPPARSVLGEGSQTLGAYEQLFPRQLALEEQAGKGYVGAQAGLLEDYGPRMAEAVSRAKSPESAALYGELNTQAMEDLHAGSGLTPSMRRELEQYTRSGQAARGFGYGPSDLTSEVMTLGSAGEELKARRRAFAESVYGFDQTGDQFALEEIRKQAPQRPAFNVFDPYASDVYNTNYNAAWADKLNTRNYNAAMLASGMAFDAALVGAGGAAAACWVAREVFGTESTLWRMFERWLMEDAPMWFRFLYLRYGERAAAWLHKHPGLKPAVRWWMINRIWRRIERFQMTLCK